MSDPIQTNPVDPRRNLLTYNLSNRYNSGDQSTFGFEQIFSGLITSSDSSTFPGLGNSTSDLLTPILLLLVSKLFGGDSNSFDGAIGSSEPHGKPLSGVLTQGSHAGHTALDFGVPVGTKVQSTMGGKVIHAGWNNEGYGNLVIVENGNYRTYYAHLSQIPVKVGQQVKEGQVIGFSGNTGNSTGPHLHYEVRKNGVTIDPTQTMGD